MMDRSGIEKILPHRYPMLLLDEVENVDGEARGKYKVRGDEFFLDGHFPSMKIVPGVILCEILAQSACTLLDKKVSDGMFPVYTGLEKVRFKSPVLPGDTFSTKCRIVKAKGPFYFLEGVGEVDGKEVVSASFSFALVPGKSVCSRRS